MQKPWRFFLQYWDGIFILTLASWLRLLTIADPFFITDQGRALLAGKAILQGNFLLGGPQTSVSGVSLGPFYYYWSAISLVLSNYDVWGPTLTVALANIGAIGLVWLWLRKYWGIPAALVGAGIFAVSPLAAHQAQIALEPSPLPLLAVLWLWGATQLTFPDNRHHWKWWLATWLCTVVAIQLNASAVILVAATATQWFWQSRLRNINKNFWNVFVGSLAGVVLGKAIVWGSTPTWYWWKSWHEFTTPHSPLVSGILIIVLVSGIGAWVQRHTFPLNTSPLQKRLLWILGVWGSWSLIAFSVKTVTGDHAFNLWFVWVAAVLGITVQSQIKHQRNSLFLVAVCCYLTGQALLASQWINNLPHPRVSDHSATVEQITQLAESREYALLYRGHLDIYDAADDHLQYLLWLKGHPPLAAARVAFDEEHPEYCERWLYPASGTPHKLIVVTAPVSGSPTVTEETVSTFLCQ